MGCLQAAVGPGWEVALCTLGRGGHSCLQGPTPPRGQLPEKNNCGQDEEKQWKWMQVTMITIPPCHVGSMCLPDTISELSCLGDVMPKFH